MSLLKKASIITTPTAYAEDYLYSIKPAYALGENLVTRGDFSADGDWVKGAGWTISGGKANGSSTTGDLYQENVVESGKYYKVTYTISNYVSGTVRVELPSNAAAGTERSANGTYTEILLSVGTIVLFDARTSFTGSIDNVIVQEITDADFDFDRNSTGTRVNEDYLIEDVPYNLAPYSESFSTWALTNATLTPNSETSPDGQNNATLIKDGTASNRHGIYYTFSAGQNTHNYNYSVYLKNKDRRYAVVTLNETTGSVYYGVVVDLETGAVTQENASNVTLQSYKVSAVGNGWYRVCITANLSYRYLTIATSNASTFTPEAYGYNNYTGENKGIYAWGVQLVKGDQPKDYLKTTDRLDIPRIDYTNGEGSILLEPSRQNIITNSNSNNLNFALDNVSMTYNQIISPEGLNNGILLQQTGSASSNSAYNYGLTTTDGTYTYSIFIKAKDSTKVRFYSSNGTVLTQDFDPTNMKEGIISGSLNLELKEYPNGWFRVSFSRTLSSATTHRLSIYPDRNNTQKGVYIYGLQVEAGSYATSLIHTSGSAVTRSADEANNAGNSDLFNSSEGVLYAEIKALANDSTARQISLSDGASSTNKVSILYTSNTNEIKAFIRGGGAVSLNATYTLSNALEFNKIALKYKLNDFSLYVNGTQVLTDNSGAIPTALSDLSLDDADGTQDFYGDAKMIAVFKEALSDEELACLTGYNNHELYMNYYNRLSYLGLAEEYNVESDINNYIL